MAKTILRYGLLLAVFLILFELLRRLYIMRGLSMDIYIGIAGLVFLALGAGLAMLLMPRWRERLVRRPPASVLNPQGFSARELDVLTFLVHGYSNREIGERLAITENTVKSHLKNIYGKLGVTNRTEAAAEARLLNIVGLAPTATGENHPIG